MDRKKKYRRLLLWFLCLDLLAVVWFGYRYLERKIPDELFVSEGKEEQVKNVLDFPFLSFDDAITVSGDGSYLLKARMVTKKLKFLYKRTKRTSPLQTP